MNEMRMVAAYVATVANHRLWELRHDPAQLADEPVNWADLRVTEVALSQPVAGETEEAYTLTLTIEEASPDAVRLAEDVREHVLAKAGPFQGVELKVRCEW